MMKGSGDEGDTARKGSGEEGKWWRREVMKKKREMEEGKC
jgi:hypothetical protein